MATRDDHADVRWFTMTPEAMDRALAARRGDADWVSCPEGLICWVTRPGVSGAASAVLTHRELAAQSGPAQIEALKAIRIANARRALKESDDET